MATGSVTIIPFPDRVWVMQGEPREGIQGKSGYALKSLHLPDGVARSHNNVCTNQTNALACFVFREDAEDYVNFSRELMSWSAQEVTREEAWAICAADPVATHLLLIEDPTDVGAHIPNPFMLPVKRAA
ncbi:MAG: hypothetical protein ACO1SV_21585 [Fimbriimonas sp.]